MGYAAEAGPTLLSDRLRRTFHPAAKGGERVPRAQSQEKRKRQSIAVGEREPESPQSPHQHEGRKSVTERRKSVICVADAEGKLENQAMRGEILLKAAVEEQENEELALEGDGEESRPLIALVAHDNM